MFLGGCIGVLTVSGCAHGQRGRHDAEAETTVAVISIARELYRAGEKLLADGEHARAADLFGHAGAQLPEGPALRALRDKLTARQAEALVQGWEQTHDAALLREAKLVLERALAHDARELPSEERRIAGLAIAKQLDRVRRLELQVRARASVTEAEMPTQNVPHSIRRSASAMTARTSEPDGEIVVRVGPRWPGESKVAAERVRSDFSNSEIPFLTGPEVIEMHGPRPLVRIAWRPELVSTVSTDSTSSAYPLARALVHRVRAELRSCYAQGYERDPNPDLRVELELSFDAAGKLDDRRIVGSGLDALANACVLDAIASSELPAAPGVAGLRLRLPLRFFYQPAKYWDDAAQFPGPWHHDEGERMPAIDAPFLQW